jgi:hypothetical protein
MSIDYKTKILKILADSPSGLTITELSNESGFHRNTISTYVRILEAENLVIKKKIGTAHLYFSKKRKYLQRNLVLFFLKALLHGLQDEFPNKEDKFKEIGRNILKYFQFPVGNKYIKEFEEARISSDSMTQLKLFQKFYNSYDFFQEDLEISTVELFKNKAIFRLTNSEFLNDNFIYFFYIACGITEGIYLQNLDKKVVCNVEKLHISNVKNESYIDISLNIF